MHAFRGHGGSWGITLPITSSISLMSRTNMANSPPIISITDSAIIISPITSSAADGSETGNHHDAVRRLQAIGVRSRIARSTPYISMQTSNRSRSHSDPET